MIFVDTSAIFAGIDEADEAHQPARRQWVSLREARATLLSHSLVEIETAVLLQSRLGVDALRTFQERFLPLISVGEVDREGRRRAIAAVAHDDRRSLSIVDRVSFSFMRERGITTAFTFDRHFADAGFDLIGADPA